MPLSDRRRRPNSSKASGSRTRTGSTSTLAIPEYRYGGHNVSAMKRDRDTRYRAEELLRRDETTGHAERPIQVARKNFRIAFEGESLDGSSALRVARVTRTPTGDYQLDQRFVPPLIDIEASEYIMAIARRLVEILRQEAPGSPAGVARRIRVSPNSASQTWRASGSCTRSTPIFPSCATPSRRDAGIPRISTPRCRARGRAHDVLGRGSSARLAELRARESVVLLHTARRTASRAARDCGAGNDRVAADAHRAAVDPCRRAGSGQVSRCPADLPGAECRGRGAEIVQRAPHLLKVGAAAPAGHLIRQALPGVAADLRPQSTEHDPGAAQSPLLPAAAVGAEWDAVKRARNIAAYVPAEFMSPELELVIVLPK